jgi:phosphoribosylformylglycinamidine cyclo-ligase
MTTIDYKSAGVDIEAGNEAVQRIKKGVQSTFSKNVLTEIGSFGALYDLKPILNEYQNPVLVQSIDGVGTKIIIARMMQKYDTIGMDLVSATTNDIIVLGAKPLTLLDYIANDKLHPERVEQIVIGMVKACRENGISLVGGETAEMPGTYLPGEQPAWLKKRKQFSAKISNRVMLCLHSHPVVCIPMVIRWRVN